MDAFDQINILLRNYRLLLLFLNKRQIYGKWWHGISRYKRKDESKWVGELLYFNMNASLIYRDIMLTPEISLNLSRCFPNSFVFFKRKRIFNAGNFVIFQLKYIYSVCSLNLRYFRGSASQNLFKEFLRTKSQAKVMRLRWNA